MDAKLKADWVRALRSDEFKQARLTLTDGKGFCCVGVFCRVAGITILESGNRCDGSDPDDGYTPIYKYLTRAEIGHLVTMNDGDRKPFADIADYIEKNL